MISETALVFIILALFLGVAIGSPDLRRLMLGYIAFGVALWLGHLAGWWL